MVGRSVSSSVSGSYSSSACNRDIAPSSSSSFSFCLHLPPVHNSKHLPLPFPSAHTIRAECRKHQPTSVAFVRVRGCGGGREGRAGQQRRRRRPESGRRVAIDEPLLLLRQTSSFLPVPSLRPPKRKEEKGEEGEGSLLCGIRRSPGAWRGGEEGPFSSFHPQILPPFFCAQEANGGKGGGRRCLRQLFQRYCGGAKISRSAFVGPARK